MRRKYESRGWGIDGREGISPGIGYEFRRSMWYQAMNQDGFDFTHLALVVRQLDAVLPVDLVELDDDVEGFRNLDLIRCFAKVIREEGAYPE